MKVIRMLILSFLLFPALAFGGITFDGVDDFVSLPNVASLNITGDMSICATFSTTQNDGGLLVWGYQNSGSFPGYALTVNQGANVGKLSFYTNNGGWDASTSNTYNNGSKNCACVTLSGTTGTFYYNGATDGTFASAAASSWASTRRIGTDDIAGEEFTGNIYDIAIWARALSAQEAINYTASRLKLLPVNGNIANLVLYYSLDDQPAGTSADGDTVHDYSSNGTNGTGDNGGNNTGLAWCEENALSYPPSPSQ